VSVDVTAEVVTRDRGVCDDFVDPPPWASLPVVAVASGSGVVTGVGWTPDPEPLPPPLAFPPGDVVGFAVDPPPCGTWVDRVEGVRWLDGLPLW
jgi:hypothetical protein